MLQPYIEEERRPYRDVERRLLVLQDIKSLEAFQKRHALTLKEDPLSSKAPQKCKQVFVGKSG